ncbi:MAG: hypothetical protein NUV51_11930, partial [Sulfuricaulis sp.]|nr:hypothetical protein [Sulfuricaulis sp.]
MVKVEDGFGVFDALTGDIFQVQNLSDAGLKESLSMADTMSVSQSEPFTHFSSNPTIAVAMSADATQFRDVAILDGGNLIGMSALMAGGTTLETGEFTP